jgi:hypothetical protein
LRVHTANVRADQPSRAPPRVTRAVEPDRPAAMPRRSGINLSLSSTRRSRNETEAPHSRHRFQNPFTMSKSAGRQAPR